MLSALGKKGLNRMPVEVDWRSLERGWRRAEFEEIVFVFQPGDPSADVYDDVIHAIQATNMGAGEGTNEAPFAEGPAQVPDGIAAVMTRTGKKDAVVRWFDDFVAHLAETGHVGRVTAAREDWGPTWTQSPSTAGLAYTLIAQFTPMVGATPSTYPLGSLDLSSEVADEVAAYGSEWARPPGPGATTFLVRGMISTRVDDDGLARQLSAAGQRYGAAQALWVHEGNRTVSGVSLAGRGRAVFSYAAPNKPWKECLQHVAMAAVHLGPKLEYGLLRRTNPRAAGWSDVSHPQPSPPTVAEYFDSNLKLQRRFVPDAYGAQVLTGAHLERARDLSSWVVRPLEEDRFLVAHPDPAAWFANEQPTAEALAAGRADFGDLILHEDDLFGSRL